MNIKFYIRNEDSWGKEVAQLSKSKQAITWILKSLGDKAVSKDHDRDVHTRILISSIIFLLICLFYSYSYYI